MFEEIKNIPIGTITTIHIDGVGDVTGKLISNPWRGLFEDIAQIIDDKWQRLSGRVVKYEVSK